MSRCKNIALSRQPRIIAALVAGACLVGTLILALNGDPTVVSADPIPPEEGGYPKFNTSIKTVTPTLTHSGGVTLYYTIELHNTGAFTAADTTLTDVIPGGTTYNGDASASASSTFSFDGDALTWEGDVGFDASVAISFSVSVDASFTGAVYNTAVISHPLISEPVTKTAETIVTDEPILLIEKTSAPAKPGANKPMTYKLIVVNQGQPAHNLPLTVTDRAPLSTTVKDAGPDGVTDGSVVTWTRSVTLDLGDTTEFTFSVDVNDAPSGTVIVNDGYQVASPQTGLAIGEPYTVTIIDPIFHLSKHVWPDPPGSNREMTYTLELLNKGSLATDLVITDRAPLGVEYRRGGLEAEGVVSWTLPALDTGESTEFAFTVYISDVIDVSIVNDDYAVCARGEGVCQAGEVLTSLVKGPTFETTAIVEPIAHKPGGGVDTDVYPTLIVRNLGPGNALDARANLVFERISVQLSDLYVDPSVGALSDGPACGEKCVSFIWRGDLAYDSVITFATNAGQNTIGGDEGTPYTATVIITDQLGTRSTDPVSDTAVGLVTHFASLNVRKSAPSVVGRDQVMTYTIDVWNSALSTDQPPHPYLWDVLPISGVTVLSDSISHGGEVQTVTLDLSSGVTRCAEVISWTLPAFETGGRLEEPRTFAVRVDHGLVSGTKITNEDYRVHWHEVETDTVFSNAGYPVTTTVKEVGLIDSYKQVTPTLASPGPSNILTYFIHIVNSGPLTVTDVSLYDYLPWESSTYQRDAEASSGEVISDIVSIGWTGDVDAFSSEIVTFTVLVDDGYQGPITNTAVITHPDLLSEVEMQAVAYITQKPVLKIVKHASRDEIEKGETLEYTIRVLNLGQKATSLIITDTLPQDTEYIPGSGGALMSGEYLRWMIATLEPGKEREFAFAVTVTQQSRLEVVNDRYGVTCDEGVTALGDPVITKISGAGQIYLPLVLRQKQ